MALKPKATIYTDGACLGNPGPGGWAAVVTVDGKGEQRLSGGAVHTTNNRMELMAVINALNALRGPHIVSLFSDSQYVVNAFNKGWLSNWKKYGWTTPDGSPRLNSDLWKTLDKLASKHVITWTWVKGHAGNKYNEICDKMATAQAHAYESGKVDDEPFVGDGIDEEMEPATEEEYGQEVLPIPDLPEMPSEYPPDLEMGELQPEADTDILNLPSAGELLHIMDKFIRAKNFETVQMEKPCGLFEFCDFCDSSEPCPCARAYVTYSKANP